jgi:class 3 adenylate cyclase
MDPPATSYLDRDGAALAYQVVGSGPVDVVCFLEVNLHLDLCWTDPHIHQAFEHAATYSRTAYLQRRGFGLSDRIGYSPTVEQQADDLLAVMDAVGMHRALLVGAFGTCGGAAMLAARSPHRVSGLILVNPLPQGPLISFEDLHGWTSAEVEVFVRGYRSVLAHWGSGESIRMWDSTLDTPYNRRLLALLERCGATPTAAAAYEDWLQHLDISDVLRSVQVPTRVVRITGNAMPEAAVAYAAELIPGATLVVEPGAPRGASVGESWSAVAHQIEEMATGVAHHVDADRFLGTVLFTDLVDSTGLLAQIGDANYRELRDSHERQVRYEVERLGGRLAKVSGDGILSVFDGPTKAVRAAQVICRDATELGVAVRAGVHTGELERAGFDVHGMTVHIGARVASAAGPGEVVVSRTVHDLVVGSGLRFESRGEQALRGVPGTWELFTLRSTDLPTEEGLARPTATIFDRAALGAARRAPRATRAAVRLGNAWQRRRATSG